MKASVLVLLVVGAFVSACSDPVNNGAGGAGGEGGENPTTASSSSAGGAGGAGGGMGGAGGGMGGAGGGAPAIPADKLGAPCGAMMACPMGYQCIVLDAMATNGFCTIPCGGQMDMVTCSAANGFMGPGQGQCVLQAKNPMTMETTNVCGVVCGAQVGLPDMCPMGLTCQDKFNAMGMPGMDGKNDFCLP